MARNHTKYISESGLVFDETIVKVSSARSELKNFLHQCLSSKPARMTEYGVGTLEEMAMRCLLHNLEGLEKESLEGVPEVMLKGIWRRITSCGLDNIHLWQLFTHALPTNPPGMKHTLIPKPLHSAPLPLVTSSLNSASLSYLVSITLSDVCYPRSSLLSLSTLSNLISLHIKGFDASKERAMIDDDTLRHWSRQASREGGFQSLRYLFMRFQPEVTARGLGYLDGFPRLELLATSRCGVVIKEAKTAIKEIGWKMTKHSFYAHVVEDFGGDGPQVHSRPWVKLVEDYIIGQANTFTNTTDDNNQDRTAVSPVTAPPLLRLQLGANITSSTLASLYDPSELQCYIRIPEEEKNKQRQKRREGGKLEEEKDPKKRKIRDAKKRDLLAFLGGM